MKTDLSLKQAEAMLNYLKNSSGKPDTNFEILCGLILCFSMQYLEMTIAEMKRQKVNLDK